MRRIFVLVALLALPSVARAQNPPPPQIGSFIVPASAVNGGGVITTPSLLAPSGSCTAGAVPYSFSGDTDTGIFNQSNGRVTFCADGSRTMNVITGRTVLLNAGSLAWDSLTGDGDLFLNRIASGVAQFGNASPVTGFTRLILGTNDATANGSSWTLTSGNLEAKTGDGTAFTGVKASALSSNSTLGAAGTLTLAGKATVYNGLTTAGNGVPSVVAAGSGAGISAAADTNRCSFTPGADGDFEVSDNILVTTAGSIAATATIGYTDEGSTARTQTIPFVLVAGSAIVTSIAAANGTVPYNGIVIHIRAKSGVAINVSTTGTFTGSVYNHRCAIRQLQ